MFSFDIGQFLDDEDKEQISTSKPMISQDLKDQLSDVMHRLEASLESLVENCGPIRGRIQEIQNQLPDDLLEVLTPAMFLEQFHFKLHRAKERNSGSARTRRLEVSAIGQ